MLPDAGGSADASSNAPTATVRAAIFVANQRSKPRLLAITNTIFAGLTLSVAKTKRETENRARARVAAAALADAAVGVGLLAIATRIFGGWKAAGLGPEVTFHTLRHTYASWMINAGVDIMTLSSC